MDEYEREREDSLDWESLTVSQQDSMNSRTEALNSAREEDHSCLGWILTSRDVYERCPSCPDRGHPELT